MKKAILLLAMFISLPSVAARFGASATIPSTWSQIDVTWSMTSTNIIAYAKNSSNTIVFCDGFVYGQTTSGVIIEEPIQGWVGLGDQLSTSTTTVASDVFTTAWTNINCNP
jgi:hypothetical protein